MNNYKIVYSLEENKLFDMLTAKIKYGIEGHLHFPIDSQGWVKQGEPIIQQICDLRFGI